MKSLAKLAAIGLVGGVAISKLYGGPGGYTGEAAGVKGRMVEDHHYVLSLKAQAIREKDVIKLNCINDKLVVMLPQMNIADALLSRIDGTDSSAQSDLMRDLTSAATAVHEQREAAAGCAGEKLIVTESSNTFTHPNLGTPTDPLPEPGSYVEPPGYASPDR